MDDIAASVAAKIAGYLVAPCGRPFIYLWNYKTNLEKLKIEVEKLKAMKHSVELLIGVGKETMPHVEIWQKSVDQIIPEAELVSEDNPEQENIQCCIGFSFLNLINHYQRCKNAAKKLEDVLKLEQEAAPFLREVACPTIPEQITLQPRKGDVVFESRKSILKGIIDALRDPDVNMVGIYGMGGVGKTTLARQVASEAKQRNLFDKIVFVEVTESPVIKDIQGEIADHLSFQFKEETVPGRASRLCDHLKKEGKVLLILDNIWKDIDFVEVGIPFKSDHKGLKLLLTTRLPVVLTNQMDSQCNFEVRTLNVADAWSLFKNTAGTRIEQPDLQSIAFKVAEKCGGMPLAIVAVAQALKNSEEYAWINALEELKNPSLESFKGTITEAAYKCIEFSYDHLDDEELKDIFLLCSRMGRTHDASIRDLFMYGWRLGFFKTCDTLEKAQCKIEGLVKKLKDNSLLLDAPNETRESHWYGIPEGERFAMHDVICDVARTIDCGKGNACNVIDDVILCHLEKKNMLKNCTSITLHNISKVPKDLRLVFPQLEFFYMKTKDTFSRIDDNFFSEMLRLQVLHLIEMNLSPLPTSLSHLVNLQTLCLDACKLGDIADIGKLEKLEILSFRGSKIKKLPGEMHQLTSIRLLDLTHCSKLEIIPPNIISCFTQLEALYIYGTLIRWEDGGLGIVGRNASINELKHLCDRLTTLEICIPNVKMSEGLFSPQLKRYKISINSRKASNKSKWIWPPKNSRTLRIHLNTNDNADEVISQLKGIKQLELCADLEGDFTKQSVSAGALSSLESLSLEDLNFVKICNVPLAAESFCQLRTITVRGCDKLTNIFSFSIDKVLPRLQAIEVSSCKNMEGIFAIEREDDVNNSELIHEIEFSQLCSVTLRGLPQLKSFCHRVKTTSQLQLTSSTNDGEIISEDMIDIPKSLFNEKVVFPNLNRLVIERCSIKQLLPSSMVNSFEQLQYLEIYDCYPLEELVFMEELKEEERKDIQFPSLKEMKIWVCPNFKGFISNDKIGFPSLKAVHIQQFKESIFNDKVEVPNIEKLTIWGRTNVEKIWHSQLVNDSFHKLKSLEVHNCKKLLNVFPSNICGRLLSSLESLDVSYCKSLEEIFDLRELSIYDSRKMLPFANLQKLRVHRCRSLKNLFSASILAKEGVVMEETPASFLFPKLTSLELDDLPELRSIYPGRHKVEGPVSKRLELSECGIHDTDEEGQMQQPSFFSWVEEHLLCKREVTPKKHNECKQKKPLESRGKHEKQDRKEHNANDLIGFPSLKEVEIKKCHQLKEFIFNDKVAIPKLEKLTISNMDNLEKIWHNQLVKDSFCKLKSLEVESCKKLLNVFPSNICGRLLSLESLVVRWCDSLEEIFDLRELSINDSQIMLSFANLQKLRVSVCRSLKNLFSASILAKEGVVMEEAPATFFFPKLTSLELIHLQELRSFYPGRHKVEGPVLKTKGIHDTDEEGQMQQSSFFSLVEEIGFPFLKEMTIMGCHKLKELIFNDKVAAPNIEKLTIKDMDNLEKIWHNQLVKDSFCKLKSLEVFGCKKLLNVFPSNICGRLLSLEFLEVSRCDSLEEIFDLQELSIYDSQSLQRLEVIGNHGDVIEDEIIFIKLKSLDLHELPSLTSFCSWNFTLKFPSLESLSVEQCPDMKIFSQGDLTVQKLQEVKIDWEPVELRSDFDLNTAIQQSYEKVNSAKDNGASSSHHFEIDQESIQQSDKEAIQQSHEEANASRMQISTTDNGASSSQHLE